jgi:excisionase family DNA binding protein
MDKKQEFMMDNTDRLIKVPELAFRLGTSEGFVRQLIKYKVLESIGSGKYRRVRKVVLNQFLEKIDGADMIDILNQAKTAKKVTS